jgi:hypothetical protein
MNKRPLAVTIIGCVYIAIGAIGFAYHLTDLTTRPAFQYDLLWIEAVRLIAIVCGIFMLLGRNWARWLAIAWMAFHVILSAFHTWSELAIHCLFFAVIAWFLLRPDATRYFRAAETRTA